MNDHDPQYDPAEGAEAMRTAYALGEVAPAVRRAMAEQLADDAAALREVESLAEIAERLRRAAAEEAVPPAALASIRAAVETRLDELASAAAKPTSEPARQAWPARVAEHWRSASPWRRLAYGVATAACLVLAIAPLAMRGRGGDVAVIPGDNAAGDADPASKAMADTKARSKTPGSIDNKASSTPPDSAVAVHENPTKPVVAPNPAVAKPGPAHVAAAAGAAHPDDAAAARQAASRQTRSERLRRVLVDAAQAKVPRDDAPARSKPPLANLNPESLSPDSAVPLAGVEAFPWMPVVEGQAAVLLTDVEGRSFEDVCESLRRGQLPPAELVWPEEFVGRFRCADPPAERGALGVALEAAECPWDAKCILVRVTLRSAGAAPGEPDSAALLRGVGVELQFTPGVVQAYRLIACGRVDAKESPAKSGAGKPGEADAQATRLPVASGIDYGDWPAGRTVTLLYALALRTSTTLAEMDDGTRRSERGKPQPAPASQRIASLRWRGEGPQTVRSGSHHLDHSGRRFADASSDLRLAALAAGFALALREPASDNAIKLAALEELVRAVPDSEARQPKAELLWAMDAASRLRRP